MSSNGKGRGRAIRLRRRSDATHARPIVAFPVDRPPSHEAPAHPGQSWSSSQAPVPGPQALSWHAAAPPYAYATVPPPDNHGRQSSRLPRLAFVPNTSPHPHPQPQSRRRRIPIPLPPQIHGVTRVALHPALATGSTHLVVDFATDAGNNAAWETPATSPALPSLTIESPRLPWAITAHASGNVVRCVSVADVIGAIHSALGLQVDREGFADWEAMTRGGSHRPDLLTARLDAGGGLVHRRGMTRLELLEGKTRFAGLAESGAGCDIWVLVLV
ncbi:hypothetical protein DFH08DRAFT_840566 [Mycena albidolilacea]|uniref:DUF6699 domain-containing protein n=1 Tax=Mycena albidolilacea TaxID=1033008 RepID=A0AAD7AMI6_9AGAR|nr:hypothetical protein DFH08DRAFT_840566 [Mycena albidolilacea]